MIVVDGGRHLDVHAHVEVLELGVDQGTDQRGGGTGLVRPGGDRNSLADLHGRFLRISGAQARVLQNLGIGVGQ